MPNPILGLLRALCIDWPSYVSKTKEPKIQDPDHPKNDAMHGNMQNSIFPAPIHEDMKYDYCFPEREKGKERETEEIGSVQERPKLLIFLPQRSVSKKMNTNNLNVD